MAKRMRHEVSRERLREEIDQVCSMALRRFDDLLATEPKTPPVEAKIRSIIEFIEELQNLVRD